jgi:hypothetical protein
MPSQERAIRDFRADLRIELERNLAQAIALAEWNKNAGKSLKFHELTLGEALWVVCRGYEIRGI